MAEDDQEKEPLFGFISYPTDWVSFLLRPNRFLKKIVPERRGDQRRAIEYFFLGLTGTIAFSTLNMSFSPLHTPENLTALKSETVNVGLLMGAATTAIIGAFLSRLLGGNGGVRTTLVILGFTLGFTWPTMTIALIVISRASSAILGFGWTGAPPFDMPIRGSVAHTASNVAWSAFFCALLVWTAGYLLYCYAAAFRAAQGVSARRALTASLLAVAATDALNPWLVAVAEAIGERFGPFIEWLLKLI